MTYITYNISDTKCKIELMGHVGYAEAGSDIVCSAVSILAQALIAHMDKISDSYTYEMEDGYVYVEGKGYEVKTAFETVITGFELLADNYPDYVEISAL